MKKQSIFVAGGGWLGAPLAAHLVQRGHRVVATARRPEALGELTALGAIARPLELDGSEVNAELLSGIDVLVVCVPPGRGEQTLPFWQRLQPLLSAARAAGVQQALFTSATSVYGGQIGWVDEASDTDDSSRARIMLQAEQLFQKQFAGRATVLRLSGLVGGVRHPGRFLAGKKQVAGGLDPVNLVHRHDVIAAICAVIDQQAWGKIYNLASPHHPNRADYYRFCARVLGLQEPEFVLGQDKPRWCNGGRICRELNWQYRYDDLYQLPELMR
ncbi:Nucleoside-diphosphate-sugar epimerase [Ferrimonas sediminum]|uniref:Nucleoside-diphosphate-sugar epimerase n=1 Tax=Ferrimonas sediminum TaxID=718193 RepID=A0A1G9AFY9_9GAMM|nr:NAD(P)H-binding protein [Ferrimonas sediminum]SDK26153.1 Nucleoside-diphosphate-sugar epimerase [Ferrimonas sediminum]